MKLYYATGACSLACRISLHEAGIPADYERVDLKTKRTEYGDDYGLINPKAYVPMLVLDDGQSITENVAVLTFIADVHPDLGPGGLLGRISLIEMLAYLSGELHVAFKPLWHGSETEKVAASDRVIHRLGLLDAQMDAPFLFGRHFTTADAYLFVMLRWARAFALPLSPGQLAYFVRVGERESVRRALAEEGLIDEAIAAPASSPVPSMS